MATLLQILAFMFRHNLETNINLTKLITAFSSADPIAGIDHARRVFDVSPQKDDSFLCNSMIKSYLDTGHTVEAMILYRNLIGNKGFKPDNYTFSSLAKCCALRKVAFWDGLGVHNHALKAGFVSNMYVATSLVDMYGKLGDMHLARKMFDEMTVRNSVAWTALIGGYVKCGDMGIAEELFDSIPEKDAAAFNLMIDVFVKRGDMKSAESLFGEMPDRTVVSWTSMIDGYCTVGNVNQARLLFDMMPEKNISSWNAMIGGYCQNKQPHEALRLFHELQTRTKLKLDDVTVVSVLPAIAELGALDLGVRVHQLVKTKKLERNPNVCTALVDMYAKCGETGKAMTYFDEIKIKEVSTWNAMINGLAVNGCAKEALDLFSEMTSSGCKPNSVTMLGVLSACNHGGLVEEGKKWFKAIEKYGLTPKIEHYGCLIDLLGRAGCLEEAERLMESMPYEANGIILSSFLFACGYAKDVSRAEKVKDKAMEMEPWNDGNYVMLRNLYAKERRWKDVKEIQGLMREKGAKKEVGCSLIEVNSKVWEFVSGDKIHPHLKEIYLLLDQLQLHMKMKMKMHDTVYADQLNLELDDS
nr:pentatricopeptide repeat-containing protein At2g44880 [Ipomoea batatas]